MISLEEVDSSRNVYTNIVQNINMYYEQYFFNVCMVIIIHDIQPYEMA